MIGSKAWKPAYRVLSSLWVTLDSTYTAPHRARLPVALEGGEREEVDEGRYPAVRPLGPDAGEEPGHSLLLNLLIIFRRHEEEVQRNDEVRFGDGWRGKG